MKPNPNKKQEILDLILSKPREELTSEDRLNLMGLIKEFLGVEFDFKLDENFPVTPHKP